VHESKNTGSAASVPPADAAALLQDSLSDAVMRARNVNVHYGDKHAVKNVSLDIGRNQVLALIGPSGCGKSTFLRCLNRMYELYPDQRATGEILIDGRPVEVKSPGEARAAPARPHCHWRNSCSR